MLLLADRNFYSYALWQAAAGTGADLLWRVKASMHLPVVRELPDGSFLAHVDVLRAVHARLRKNGLAPPPRQHARPGVRAAARHHRPGHRVLAHRDH